jgi:hypothetical protein
MPWMDDWMLLWLVDVWEQVEAKDEETNNFFHNIHACLCVYTTIHSFDDKDDDDDDDTKGKNAIACIMDHYDTFMTALYTITLYIFYIRYIQTLFLSLSSQPI